MTCAGSGQLPIEYRIEPDNDGGIHDVIGLCPGCGHFYAVNQRIALRRHDGDDCTPTVYSPTCRKNQRANHRTYWDWPIVVKPIPLTQTTNGG